MTAPVASAVTSASHTCVVRPPCTSDARQAIPPSSAVPKKFVFSSDRREADPALRQIGGAPVAARRVGERDDGAAVQKSVRRQQVRPHVQPAFDDARPHLNDLYAEQPRQRCPRARVQPLGRQPAGIQRPRPRRAPVRLLLSRIARHLDLHLAATCPARGPTLVQVANRRAARRRTARRSPTDRRATARALQPHDWRASLQSLDPSQWPVTASRCSCSPPSLSLVMNKLLRIEELHKADFREDPEGGLSRRRAPPRPPPHAADTSSAGCGRVPVRRSARTSSRA